MEKALVTGGSGFIGSHIARTLTSAGYRTRVFFRPGSRLDLIRDLPVEHATGDVMDIASLEAAMEGCQWVFHTAAVADYWRAARVRMYLINTHGTRNVLEAARRTGVKRVILTSSAAAVGLRPDRPSDESEAFNLPPARFPYGHSKWLSEQEAYHAIREYGQDVVILNPSMVFGPGDMNMISGAMVVEAARGLIPPVYPVGSVTVVDVRDVAQAHVAAAERGRSGERYLLGTQDVTYRELWQMIAQLVGKRAPRLPLPAFLAPATGTMFTMLRALRVPLPANADQIWLSARAVLFDTRKARTELGAPSIDVQKSLSDTFNWYRTHGLIKAVP